MVQYDFSKVYVLCVCEKNISDISDNGRQFQRLLRSHGQIFDTSRKILSQDMTICIVEALVLIFKKL